MRFPGFSGEWKEKRTNEIAPLQRGFDLPTSNVIKGEYPVVYSNGVLRKHNEFKVHPPGVITGRSGTIGKVTYLEKNYWPHNTSLWVTDFKLNSPKFIYYFYITFKLEKYSAGSTVPTLNRNDIHFVKKRIPLPIEQQKIASFLTLIDDRIQTQNKIIDNFESLIKGLEQKIFSKQLKFKDEDGNDFPEWEKRKISDLFKVTRGNVLSMNKVNSKPNENYKYPVYSSQTKNNGLSGYYNEFLYENAITWTTDGANAGNVNFRKGKFYCTNVCGVLISGKGFANSFIAKKINSISKKYVSYVGNPKLMNNVMAEIRIEVPCLKEQIKLSIFLALIDEKLSKEKDILNSFEGQKKYLLQNMFI